MSLITGFNFKGFECDLHRQVADRKLGVSLSALTATEMEQIGFVKVKAKLGTEDRSKPCRPVINPTTGEEKATFWDTRMGNFDVKSLPTQPCSTCAAIETDGKGVNTRCQGHFGIIEMPLKGPQNWLLVYNPIVFSDLLALIQAQCFSCHKFRASEWETTRYECALELIDNGLVGDGFHLLHQFPKASAHHVAASAKRLRDADQMSMHDVEQIRRHVLEVIHRSKSNEVSIAEKNAADKNNSDGAAINTPIHPSVVDVRSKLVSDALREFKSVTNKCCHCGALNPVVASKNSQIYFKYSKSAIETNKLLGHVTQQQASDWECERELHKRERQLLSTEDACVMSQRLCSAYADVISRLFPNLGSSTVNVPFLNQLEPAEAFRVFFLDRLLVPPLPLRLASGIQIQPGGAISPDDRTRDLNDILKYVEEIEIYYKMSMNGTATARQLVGNEGNIKSLQLKVDNAYSSVLEKFSKKEGLFRMHMMGKRVNQACRSVISPDFTVEPNEVLLPRTFARNLSFPEIVNFNFENSRTTFLRRCVVNGPYKYPGATHLERREADGKVDIYPLEGSEQHREEIAEQYFALARNGSTIVVHRHVVDGDRLIFNRQPTLHRASMLGYRARVLSSLKTLRFHYVNGKSFNADFDGDEMNVHVPQSLEARAELETIMDANLHFLVATSGRPIRGLIQDHIAAGVLLTIPDSMFDRSEFTQLLYSSLEPYIARGSITNLRSMIPLPAIMKPKALWSGKQLVSVILKWLTGVYEGNSGVTTRGRAQVPTNSWTMRDAMAGKGPYAKTFEIPDEHAAIFVNSEMLCGVLDKAQIGGAHMSVPHLLHDIYGPHKVGDFFGAIGRLLTIYLRSQGMSMGCDDMLMDDDEGRKDLLRDLDHCAMNAASEDQAMQAIAGRASNLVSEFIPRKLSVKFPENQLILMTISGAKGSNVNATQMALVLGQQLFDGVRVRRMSSGKTLPGFFCGENRARSKGFAMGRFLSGIRPHEYTIHATAGRDGLIDTGIKTSRSGHLQRCLIKGLESLTVHWDGTVRDSDGSVAQFSYGGDGLDPMKVSTLREWEATSSNSEDLMKRYGVIADDNGTFSAGNGLAASNDEDEWVTDDDEENEGETDEADNDEAALAAADDYDSYSEEEGATTGASKWAQPAVSREDAKPLPAHIQKSLDAAKLRVNVNPATLARSRGRRTLEEAQQLYQDSKKAALEALTKKRLPRCKVDPGEAVGILAAQAAGEPSTQMTLNTFHQAGQTASHVTEGIPRLRELMIHASVSNPAVIVPVTDMKPCDHDAIQRVMGFATPVKLSTGFAAVVEPYKWHVQRDEVNTTLSLVMIFSEKQLDLVRQQLLMTVPEHKLAFYKALKDFAKIFCKGLKGVVKMASGASGANEEANQGAMNTVVMDPADMEGGDGDVSETGSAIDTEEYQGSGGPTPVPGTLDDDEADHKSSFLLDADDEAAERDREDDDEAAAPRMKSERVKSEYNGGEDDDDEADALDDADLTAAQRAHAELDGKVKRAAYRKFPVLDLAFFKKEVRVHISPESLGGDAEYQDFFPVRMTVNLPSKAVAVIPIALDAAIEEVQFPVSVPQFDVARWAPNKKNDGGELVFQGPSTSLKDVMKMLLTVAGDCEAIQVYRATSTNYNDVVRSLGVEAAYASLLKELDKLFSRYSVDERHLSLIADTSTRRGKWESFNFTGLIAHDPSPIFQMTFASATRFLHHAVSRGVPDTLTSLSSAIVVGEKPKVGTACADVRMHPAAIPDIVERRQ